MIRAEPLNLRKLGRAKAFMRKFPQTTQQITSEIFNRRVAPVALKVLTRVPAPHKRPTDWTSEKQRRWWFAVGVKNWRGRTGTLLRSYTVGVLVVDDTVSLTISNKKRYFKYVKGKRKQRMHVVWTPIEDDLRFIRQETVFALEDELPKKLREAMKEAVR